MWGQRRRRWAHIKPTLVQRPVPVGCACFAPYIAAMYIRHWEQFIPISKIKTQRFSALVYFYLILLLSVFLSVITMYINFILDVELILGAGHLYSTS